MALGRFPTSERCQEIDVVEGAEGDERIAGLVDQGDTAGKRGHPAQLELIGQGRGWYGSRQTAGKQDRFFLPFFDEELDRTAIGEEGESREQNQQHHGQRQQNEHLTAVAETGPMGVSHRNSRWL